MRERESGAKARPVWRALVEKVRRGEVRAVVFWAIDRIGRNKVQVAHDMRELARYGASLVSVQDAWLDQPDGPMRALLIDFMSWVAEGERSRLIERTKRGMKRARDEGKQIGRPRVEVDVEFARSMLHAGDSLSHMARELGCSRATLRAALGVPPGLRALLRGGKKG